MFCHQCGHTVPEGGGFCPACGTALIRQDRSSEKAASATPPQSHPADHACKATSPNATNKLPFYTGKLVIGIICLVLSMWILFQSCVVGAINSLEQSGDVGGSAGLLFVLLWWIAGIIGIASRTSRKATAVASGCYFLAALTGLGNHAVFEDLFIYGIASLGFGIAFAWSAYDGEKKAY